VELVVLVVRAEAELVELVEPVVQAGLVVVAVAEDFVETT